MNAAKIDVTIRIETAEAGRMDKIVEDLKSCGLECIECRERFMIVHGSADPEALDAMRAIVGVASVRKDSVYKAQA